jgi:4-hydroxy-3-methylbut-2-enyl diphosphate reductase
MEVILASPRGFCAGVNMAIDVVEQALQIKGPPVYVYHEIVHNRHVVAGFEGRGAVFVTDIEQIPEGQVVIYSAHGIPPSVRQRARQRRLFEVDATCPLVTKVHLEVLRFARDGYTIFFIGHRNHDEAVGTVGEAPGSIIVVENEADVASAQPADPEKVAYVTQTTLSVSEASRTIAALTARFPNIKSPGRGDICYATTNRQAAVRELSATVDVVLVVGSRNSSNSRRLVETAADLGRPAYLIDDASEVMPEWLAGRHRVLITAGASAPEHLVQALVARLQKEFGASVKEAEAAPEKMHFELPRALKQLSR